jgi:integrase/recombinase XerD
MEGLLDAFIAFIRAERGLSGKTVDAYAADLTVYFEDLRARGLRDVTKVKQEDVNGHVRFLSQRGLSRRSQARHLAAVRGFHRFLVAEKYAEKDPTEDVDTPRSERKMPSFLTLEEVEQLLAAPDERRAALRSARTHRSCAAPRLAKINPPIGLLFQQALQHLSSDRPVIVDHDRHPA